jgi:hypothetical protein
VLARGRVNGNGHSAVLLRLDVEAASDAETQDEVESLLTDLRMLGLRPTLLESGAL